MNGKDHSQNASLANHFESGFTRFVTVNSVGRIAHNVQRLPARRHARTSISHAPLNSFHMLADSRAP
jgi:hypothetical protein